MVTAWLCLAVLALSGLAAGQLGEEVTRALTAVAEYHARLDTVGEEGERAIDAGGVKDFSDVVLGMIESLQDIEDKGDEMVQKIDVQEEHLGTLSQEIKAKETYIAAINRKIKINEAKHSEMVETLRVMEEEKLEKSEETRGNSRRIKAQEVRLQRLLKDITTKVNYVQVIDSKVKEMENMTRSAARGLLSVQERRDGLGAEVAELESRRGRLEREVRNYTLVAEGRRQRKQDESRQFEMEVKLYNETIEQMEGALQAYREKIGMANNTLSSLELSVRDNSPSPPAADSTNLWPALLTSIAANFAMGGVLMGVFDFPAPVEEPELPVYDYEDTQGVDMQVGDEVNPLLQLARRRVREERERVQGKKSNFLRRRGLDPYQLQGV